MTNDDKARTALGIIAGGIAAVALTNSGLTPQSATLRWIAYCVVAGLLINSQQGMRLGSLMLAAILSSFGLVFAVLWMSFIGHGELPSMSGRQLDFDGARLFSSTVIAGLFVVSVFGVAVGGLARPATLDLLQRVSQADLNKAKQIESFLKVVVSIFGIAALFLL